MKVDELRRSLEAMAGPEPAPDAVARAEVARRARRGRRARIAVGVTLVALIAVVAVVAIAAAPRSREPSVTAGTPTSSFAPAIVHTVHLDGPDSSLDVSVAVPDSWTFRLPAAPTDPVLDASIGTHVLHKISVGCPARLNRYVIVSVRNVPFGESSPGPPPRPFQPHTASELPREAGAPCGGRQQFIRFECGDDDECVASLRIGRATSAARLAQAYRMLDSLQVRAA